MKVFAYKSRKDFLKIHRLAKVHGDGNAQTCQWAWMQVQPSSRAIWQNLCIKALKHTPSDPVMPLPITFPK